MARQGTTRVGILAATSFVAFVAACGTGGSAGLGDGIRSLSGEDEPGEGSEQAPGVSSEDEDPTKGEDETGCPPCPITCLLPTTTTTVTTDSDGGRTETTETGSKSTTFKSEIPGGGCGFLEDNGAS